MLSVLVFDEIDGDKLTDEEIFAGFLLLMIASPSASSTESDMSM
jgi:hypothetical protein